MTRIALRSFAVSLLLLALAAAEERPRYGGTLRIQVKEAVISIDPADGRDLTLARTRIAALIFDRLTEIDDHGQARPQLAVSWTSDATHKSWRFTLRPGVTFHDGTPLTSAIVVTNFTNDARWQVRAGNGPQVVVFECPNPIYDLPAILADPRHSIVLRTSDGVQGTGPFKITAWQPSRQLSLAANLDHHAGRPYLDGIEIQMGNSLREQLTDLRLDRDDLVDVDLEQARRLEAVSQRVETSQPSRLLTLYFPNGSDKVRELLSRSINREAIHAAILKKSGAPAAGLLPQWLSGYAVLFDAPNDAAEIQKLRAAVGKSQPLFLAYDPADVVTKAVADRIAVNARDVGLTVNVYAEKGLALASTGQGSRADILLVSLPLQSTSAAQTLSSLTDAAQLNPTTALAASTPEQLYLAEAALVDGYKLIPIAHLTAAIWVASRVRNWKPAPDGRWRLDQVWVESNK